MISYRRVDGHAAKSIHDQLAQSLKKHRFLRDVDAIEAGDDFLERIAEMVREADVVLAIVGPQWLGEPGRPRIDESDDPVRFEIRTALGYGKTIVPVTLNDAKMPTAEELPEDIRRFHAKQAVRVDSGLDFYNHVARLRAELAPRLARKWRRPIALGEPWQFFSGPRMGPVMAVWFTIATALLGYVWLALGSGREGFTLGTMTVFSGFMAITWWLGVFRNRR